MFPPNLFSQRSLQGFSVSFFNTTTAFPLTVEPVPQKWVIRSFRYPTPSRGAGVLVTQKVDLESGERALRRTPDGRVPVCGPVDGRPGDRGMDTRSRRGTEERGSPFDGS